MSRVTIYTDGACSGNPGPGGWGATLAFADKQRDICGGEPATTNNRMEMRAAIEALNTLKRRCVVDLYTDSTYLRQGITQWMDNWKRKQWKTAAGKPVKNQDLWQSLDEARSRHEVHWHWVKGHSGDPGNERADELARQGLEEARQR